MKVVIKSKKAEKRFEERNKANKRRAERKEARYWDRKTEVIYG